MRAASANIRNHPSSNAFYNNAINNTNDTILKDVNNYLDLKRKSITAS